MSPSSAPIKVGSSLRWMPILYILLQNTLYGFGDPISKAAYEVLPVYSLLSARYGIALAFLLAVFGRRILRGLRACSWRDWLAPSLCIGGAYVVGNIALVLTAATAVAFLRSLSTVMTPLLAWAVFRHRFGKKHLPVLVLAVGRGELKPEDMADILASRDRTRAGETVPACGLCLTEVRY